MPRLIVSAICVPLLLLGAVACSGDDAGDGDAPAKDEAAADSEKEERHELVSTYASNGGNMTVVVGDRIRVVLEGPSWTFLPTSDEDVVRQDGETEVVEAAEKCGSGGDCGYATAYFDVVENGEAEIRAGRSDCVGAEEGCTTGDGAYKLTVSVPEE